MTLPYAHIACCIDDSPAAEDALAQAIELWRAAGGRLSLVRAAPHPLLVEEVDGELVALPEDINAEARRRLEARARAVPGAEAVLVEGLAGPEVCRWAEDAGVDLLVTGAGRGRLEGVLLGSFSRYVVGHAACPVLVVRRAPARRGAGRSGTEGRSS